jgi:hypothetical protein
MAELVPTIKHLMPAHNVPVIPPGRLVEVKHAIVAVREGKKKVRDVKDGGSLMKDVVKFEFEHFSFLIRRDLLKDGD